MFRRAGPLSLTIALAGCSLFVLDEGEYSGGRDVTADSGSDATDDAMLDAAAGPDVTEGDAGADPDAGGTSRYADAVLADGPILYLRFGEKSGSAAKAVVGPDATYGVTGFALGSPGALAGDDDSAVTLTDGAGRITVPSGFAFEETVPFSVEIWAKPAAANTNLGFVADHTTYGEADRRGWSLFVGSGGVAYDRWATPEIRTSLREPALTTNQWHHVVGTYDGTTQRLYADGVRIAQVTSSVKIPSRPSVLIIGNQSCDCSGGNAFIGTLDELAIYDKALTDAQIAAHLAAAK